MCASVYVCICLFCVLLSPPRIAFLIHSLLIPYILEVITLRVHAELYEQVADDFVLLLRIVSEDLLSRFLMQHQNLDVGRLRRPYLAIVTLLLLLVILL